MQFEVTQIVSGTCLGNDENDDRADWVRTESSTYAWVIDGGTSVADRNYVGAKMGDVAWFANALSNAIKANSDRELTAKELHAAAVADVAKLYGAAVTRNAHDVPLYARPIAAITLLRIIASNGNFRGDLFHLADCPAFALDRRGAVIRISENDNMAAEQMIRDRVVASQAQMGFAPKEIMGAQLPWLRQRREMQLRKDKLRISTPVEGAAFAGGEKMIELDDVAAIVLMSDGFERYASHYQLGDAQNLVQSVVADGPEAVLGRIRAVEAADPACSSFLRLKASDDATCLVLQRW